MSFKCLFAVLLTQAWVSLQNVFQKYTVSPLHCTEGRGLVRPPQGLLALPPFGCLFIKKITIKKTITRP